jgi:hypothetical protein
MLMRRESEQQMALSLDIVPVSQDTGHFLADTSESHNKMILTQPNEAVFFSQAAEVESQPETRSSETWLGEEFLAVVLFTS